MLGYEDLRPWGSCFLQYLWEFVLGIWLAQKVNGSGFMVNGNPSVVSERNSINHEPYSINQVKWLWLIGGVVVGMGLTGAMGWNGGVLKLYNDIPSLMGYLSLLLIVYKASCSFGWLTWVKRFFMWASGFGYELYLAHSLVYTLSAYLQKDMLPLWPCVCVSFVMAYVVAWAYSWILKKTIYRK